MTCEDILEQKFQERKIKNESYSKRAFARDLNISPSFLTEVLAKKSKFSIQKAHEIANNLNLSPDELSYFLASVQLSYIDNNEVKKKLEQDLAIIQLSSDKSRVIKEKYFQIVSHWYTGAILILLEVFDGEPQWQRIAARLKILESDVIATISNLLMLGIIKIVDGRYQKSNSNFVIEETPSHFIRQYHRAFLRKSIDNLKEDNIEHRNYQSCTFACASAKLPLLREEIKKFRDSLIQKYSDCEDNDSVYQLNMQLFKLDTEEF